MTAARTFLSLSLGWAAAAGLSAQSAAPAPAPATKETPPATGSARDFRVPAARTTSLPNGLKLTFVPYGSVPKVTVLLTLEAGYADEAAGQVWLAELAGRLIQEGTATRSATEVSQAAASMGGAVVVDVGPDTTTVGGDALSDFAADMVRLVADVARNPRLPESQLPRLKADLKRELAIARQQPQPLAEEKFAQALYGDHPYGRTLPTAEGVDALTLEQVRAFHAAHFGAAHAHLYVAGRFDAPAVEAAARAAFGDWRPGDEPRRTPPKPTSSRAVYLIDRPDAVQSTFVLGLPVVPPAHPDYVALRVANTLLGGYFSSRIVANLRESKGYTYSPYSELSARRQDAYWAQHADVTTAVTGPALKEVFAEIDRLQAEPPSETELLAVKNYMSGTFVLQNSSRAGLIAQLQFVEAQGLPEDYLGTIVGRIQAVTPADVQRATATYIQDDKATLVVVGDRKLVEKQLEAFGPLK